MRYLDGCKDCGMHDGTGRHLRGCPRGHVPLSTGERVFIVSVAVAAFAAVLSLVALLSGCHVGELAAPCDTMTLGTVRAACHQAVRKDCARNAADVVDETCPTLIECQRRIESWRACSYSDAGVPVSTGGAS